MQGHGSRRRDAGVHDGMRVDVLRDASGSAHCRGVQHLPPGLHQLGWRLSGVGQRRMHRERGLRRGAEVRHALPDEALNPCAHGAEAHEAQSSMRAHAGSGSPEGPQQRTFVERTHHSAAVPVSCAAGTSRFSAARSATLYGSCTKSIASVRRTSSISGNALWAEWVGDESMTLAPAARKPRSTSTSGVRAEGERPTSKGCQVPRPTAAAARRRGNGAGQHRGRFLTS